jgi:hypothetical protein
MTFDLGMEEEGGGERRGKKEEEGGRSDLWLLLRPRLRPLIWLWRRRKEGRKKARKRKKGIVRLPLE